MYLFFPTEEHLQSDILGPYRTFGIRILYVDETGVQEISGFSDVSEDLDFVSDFCLRCLQAQPEPVHVPEMLADWLATI